MTTVSRPLTPMQTAFVREYHKDNNGTQAAIRAGAAPNSAAVTASKWLTNPKIREAIDAKTQRIEQRAEIDAAAATRRLWDLSEKAEDAGQFGPAVSAIATIVKKFPEFRDASPVDARSITVNFPDSTSPEEKRALLKALRGE